MPGSSAVIRPGSATPPEVYLCDELAMAIAPRRLGELIVAVRRREPESIVRVVTAGELERVIAGRSGARAVDLAPLTSDGSDPAVDKMAGALVESMASASAETAEVSVDPDRCSACGACARSCQPGALEVAVGESRFRLSLEPERCNACGSCVASCPESALELTLGSDGTAPRSGRHTVMRAPLSPRCPICGDALFGGLSAQVLKRRLGAALPDGMFERQQPCPECRLRGLGGQSPVPAASTSLTQE